MIKFELYFVKPKEDGYITNVLWSMPRSFGQARLDGKMHRYDRNWLERIQKSGARIKKLSPAQDII